MLQCQSKLPFSLSSYRSEVKARQDVKPDIRQPPFTDYRQPPLDYRQPPGGDYPQPPPLDYRQHSPDTRQYPLSDYRQPQVPLLEGHRVPTKTSRGAASAVEGRQNIQTLWEQTARPPFLASVSGLTPASPEHQCIHQSTLDEAGQVTHHQSGVSG